MRATLAARWAVVAALVALLVTPQGALAAPHGSASTSIWTVVPSPDTGGGDDPVAVAATSSTDAWLVGDRFDLSTNHYLTLIEHWNGTAWSVVPSPSPRSGNWLYGVAAISHNDVWAVGQAQNPSYGSHTLSLHWDGTTWSDIPTPSPGVSASLLGVSASTSNRVWAVGGYGTDKGYVLAERWDGSMWNVATGDSPGTVTNALVGVSATQKTAWAAGITTDGGAPHTIAEHVCPAVAWP